MIPVQTRLEPAMHAELEALAVRNRRSLSAELYLAIKARLDAELGRKS